MVYKTFKINSNKIIKNSRYSLKEHLKDLIPFYKYEGQYGGKVDGLEDTIGVFLIPYIYFPSSSESQIFHFKDIDGYVDVKIKKSDIESYFNQVSPLEEIFETDLTVGTYVENRNWILQEDHCRFLGTSYDRIDIEILINDTPVNVYFKTDVNIRIFKKYDVIQHLRGLTENPEQSFHIEMDRNDFKVRDKFGDKMVEFDINWPDFYMEFADKLLEYKDNRTELIEKIEKVFSNNDMLLPKLEIDRNGDAILPIDIDPFTIYGLFNKQITSENRKKIINGLKNEFSVQAPIPTSFNGVPVLSNRNAAFYRFQFSRGEDDIDNIWNLFEIALKYSKDYKDADAKEFAENYDKVISQRGIRWNITIALYWIRPNDFISLDSRSRAFLSKLDLSEKLSKSINSLKIGPPNGEDYLKLCEDFSMVFNESNDFKSFSELSAYAYEFIPVDEDESRGIGDGNVSNINYWIYSPGEGANKWEEFYNDGLMAIGWEIGDLRDYHSKTEFTEKLKELYNDNVNHFNDVNCLWQFTNEIQIGDVIFAKRGMNEIIGRGIVESVYKYDEERGEYTSFREVDWTDKGSWPYGDNKKKLHMKTLTKVTDYREFVDEINDLIGPILPPEPPIPPYTEEDFLEEVYITEEDYETLVKLLKNKKNLIVQGAPGVGKTFMAKRLAYSIMGVKDVDRVMMVQFHQSYSYEDFVMGYRPSKDGFELREGSFYKFCKKAEDDDENDYFFIIDEINRGNLSKIFGELFMLIENDKRGEKNKIQLLYSDELFYIPKNVHIIGLMNTADRSLAMIDYALRRRFAFFDLKPGFSSDGFNSYKSDIDYPIFDNIITVMEELNKAIKDDETLGEGFRIGHSYFCNLDDEEDVEEKLNYIVEYEIIPLLKEYWFDEPTKFEEWSEKLRNSLE